MVSSEHYMKRLLLTMMKVALLGCHTPLYANGRSPSSNIVPEPETIVLLGIALVAFALYGLYMRKKRKIK